MTFSIGDIVDSYRILQELGRGGMGRVYLVEHTITRRLEAMKVLEGGRPGAPDQAARSLREIQLQASLDHPNIAAVHNAFWAGDDLVLVMELIEGSSLSRRMQAGRVPLASAIDYACQSLAALGCAHAHGVVHRDVSPSNILITRAGVVKLTDFGLSGRQVDVRLSQAGSPAGSLFYMSPEQVREVAWVDARSDLYSLGAVLYELATGVKPFAGASAFSLMMDHVWKAPPAPIQIEPHLPLALNDAILRSLEKDPAQRFQSAEEFQRALTQVKISADPVAIPRTPPVEWMVGVAAALAVFTLAVGGFLSSRWWRAPAVPQPLAALQMIVSSQPAVAKTPERKPPPLAVRVPTPRPQPPASETAAPTPELEHAILEPETPPPPPGIAIPPPEDAPVIADAGSSSESPPQAEPEAAPKSEPNFLKKGLTKLWRLMRHKKAGSTPAPPTP